MSVTVHRETRHVPPHYFPLLHPLPSLIKERNTQTSAEWRRQMQEVDVSVVKQLREGIKGGFDEERFGTRIGFANLKK